MTPRKAAVFIGNSIFGDDRIGILTGERLKQRLEGGGYDVHVIERTGLALLDCLEGHDNAMVVDSICDGRLPVGSVSSYSVKDFELVKPVAPHFSGVPEAVKLMQDLGMSVPEVSVIGINVRNPYDLSFDLADDLESLRDEISEEVYEMITRPSRRGARGCA